MQEPSRLKTILVTLAVGLLAFITFGLIWFLFLGPATPVGIGWYLFSFAAGLSMIVLPCTLPLAFVIVPLSMGKGPLKGLGIALTFGLGVAIMLSVYGIIAALLGGVAIGTLGAPLEIVKNWLYFIAGTFAYIFALGELGLVRFRMPSYTGAAPMFIQKQGDYLKAFLLGIFLGNIGVGCPHPATPVILTRIAASGDAFYGWLLFFVHAIGRILPLLLLAILGILGVNALSWLIARREKVERATGWGMVFVAAFILVLGFFTHGWWVNSGQHTLLESITQEERFISIIAKRVGVAPPHVHGLEKGSALLGFPLWLGNWVLVILWTFPLWWFYLKKKKTIPSLTEEEKKIESAKLPLYFSNFLLLTALLALVFIYVLPNRFLIEAHVPQKISMATSAMHHGGEAIYHEEKDVKEGLAVNLNVTPAPFKARQIQRFDFFVNQKPGGIPLRASDLELNHTKLMHVIGVRSDMNEFFHIHPQPTSTLGVFTVDYVFPNPGLYKIWSEIKKDGTNHSFGHPEIFVQGEGAGENKDVNFRRSVIIDNYEVLFKLEEPVIKEHAHNLLFDIHTLTGEEVEVEEYLGASMHLTIIKDDWRQFIHAHPETMNEADRHGALRILNEAKAHENESPEGIPSKSEAINFKIVFPEAGLYKAFAQFRPKGTNLPADEALKASFWIEVKAEGPPRVSTWWGLFIASAIAIVILSWAVRKFLQVKTKGQN